MPYNNTAIPPTEEITGSASLPLSRVKKILQLDEDISQCSNNAAFVITVATEMFVRYLAEQAHNVVKSERKPRRNIQYKDIANAVSRIDNLEFLSDVIPRTTTYREYKEKKARSTKPSRALQDRQTTLDGKQTMPQHISERSDASHPMAGGRIIPVQVSGDGQAVQTTNGTPAMNGTLIFEHYEPNGGAKRDGSGDVEMG